MILWADRQDLRYCRAVLPRVSRTFALNIRLLRGTLGDAVRVGYLLCRTADALEDSWPGCAADLRQRFEQLLSGLQGDAAAAQWLASQATELAGGRADLELVSHLPLVLRAFHGLPEGHRATIAAGVQTLARGMAAYAARAAGRAPDLPYLDTEAELDDYCWVVAGCVGVMLTGLYADQHGAGSPPTQLRRLEIAPVVGRALQLTNILLDWPADVRRGRCYLPASWLAERGLRASDLVGRENDAVQTVAERLEARARAALARVPDYVELIPERHQRFRLFCLWPALWALGSLEHARRDLEFPWGPRRPRLPRRELFGAAIGSLVPAHQTQALSRLRAASGPAGAKSNPGSD
ncbi:MAG TPA: squalene/phytoene synthase family protein [Candidatus Eisenbacteria bacterium]|jgi:farnesyl-diphosphate farnesyltransferase